MRRWNPMAHALSLAAILLLLASRDLTAAQFEGLGGAATNSPTETDEDDQGGVSAPARVTVDPTARDEEIEARLGRILKATGWFGNPQVEVEEGVVFLTGTAQGDAQRKWAGDLARNTQDVVAVVNRIESQPTIDWNLLPAREGMQQLLHDMIGSLPFLLVSLLILPVAWLVAVVVTRALRHGLRRRITTGLLREVVVRSAGAIVFLLGLYIVLRIAGLTRLALTLLGGTGLIGLVIGIAFRDITENFLASIFLSLQRPFLAGDLVQIESVLGYVQRLTVRTTVVMTLDGNEVQIPNSTVYRSTIRNFTSNANRRDDFTIGIGFDVAIAEAQAIALQVVREHPAVLKDPEPWVLVDNLGTATVNLKVYFWLNGKEHSWLKVRSSVIRLVKRAFQENGVSMPDAEREIVFPEGVPIIPFDGKSLAASDGGSGTQDASPKAEKRPAAEPDTVSTEAEGQLCSEAGQIEQQARNTRQLDGEEDLLKSAGQRGT